MDIGEESFEQTAGRREEREGTKVTVNEINFSLSSFEFLKKGKNLKEQEKEEPNHHQIISILKAFSNSPK
ncbi:hypothetical protein Csa_004097 [Cucumis sativus]|uniref:Uncharacterized protein n=1 Tax=Cucumis sativus TaxID=3659 RepID=A0A0A0KH88_CUCSA|nr:hypothetical protein Csa_004097 [Cucumis sativus]